MDVVVMVLLLLLLADGGMGLLGEDGLIVLSDGVSDREIIDSRVTLDSEERVGLQVVVDSVDVGVTSNSYSDSSSGLILDDRIETLETVEGVRVKDGVREMVGWNDSEEDEEGKGVVWGSL